MLNPDDLKTYQRRGIEHIMLVARCAIWIFMGGGKTATVLTALDRLQLVDTVFPALVLAPLRVAQSTWPEEPVKWSHLKHLRVKAVTGDEKQRLKALAAPADIYAINYEQVPWLVGKFGKSWPFKTIVADEATRTKSFRLKQGGKRMRSLAAVAWKFSNRFIQLSGTPAPNGLKDLWGQAWFLDQGERLGRTYSLFTQRWFKTGYDGFSLVPLEGAQTEIESRLQDICLSFNPKDYFDIKEPIEVVVPVTLPPGARALYRDMERQMFMEIQRAGLSEVAEIEAFNAASRTGKCLQLAAGAAYVDGRADQWEEVHDEKIKALESILEETGGMPVLVAYNFRSDIDRLGRAFPQGRVLDKSPQTLRDWNAGEIPLLFAHPKSAGHGLNLQYGGNVIVFFNSSWNLEEDQQIIERIGPVRQMQAGFDRPVYIYRIVAQDTIEQDVIERLKTKATIQQTLMDAMKRRST